MNDNLIVSLANFWAQIPELVELLTKIDPSTHSALSPRVTVVVVVTFKP
jgi:hypothetical protein